MFNFSLWLMHEVCQMESCPFAVIANAIFFVWNDWLRRGLEFTTEKFVGASIG
jgi:hypothetical protein